VSIIKSAGSADESMDNVGIYAPNGTVTINLQGFKSSFYFSGTIVANKVEIIPSAGDVGGSITWSSQFAKSPPPGFTDIILLSRIWERAPE